MKRVIRHILYYFHSHFSKFRQLINLFRHERPYFVKTWQKRTLKVLFLKVGNDHITKTKIHNTFNNLKANLMVSQYNQMKVNNGN